VSVSDVLVVNFCLRSFGSLTGNGAASETSVAVFASSEPEKSTSPAGAIWELASPE
jgi:hypothetical protein